MTEVIDNEQLINKGTGAGGANTNANGLPYEIMTDLSDRYTVVNVNTNIKNIRFSNSDKIYVTPLTKKKFLKMMSNELESNIAPAHGCKEPDEVYVDIINHVIFIIEKKFQNKTGSVCEKIQTPHFKKWQYERMFPSYNIVYIYCLSTWFRENCQSELEYLEYLNIPVFWGNDNNYKDNIINFMINYNQPNNS
tara:strand:- start:41 stop:619 length:579 start_codon:yes stop_codon:yes gene_type:complete